MSVLPYQHKVNNSGKKWRTDVWVCATQLKTSVADCGCNRLKDTVLREKFMEAYNEFVINRPQGADVDSARQAMQPDNKAALQQVEQEIIEIQEQVLALHKLKQQRGVSAADYAAQVKDYSEQLQALESKQAELQTTENKYSSVKLWLENFAEHRPCFRPV